MNLLEILTTAEKLEAYLNKVRPGNPNNAKVQASFVDGALKSELFGWDPKDHDKFVKTDLYGITTEFLREKLDYSASLVQEK